ncbi:5-formyltetrahydrofolate cyclo-ligase [Leptospira selangorensis]|uniref:5-formyltetrahydrofolate cyclo-ligase n=1 Tax=Leptospira selangorensis TaxID=2484982 RepID=A0A4R9G541_9LEPT|nr:5-formyltetrahydrofolate cyclo-ligase [Leptospira selangorensis]TGK05837.1 5-formyltetrahydrofolate cyclo-ligase [Leptospira selangorensis]TGM12365.1 5-formyltetrahydrofolate cyclo-ligase [Leptospira selangorensis]TGM14592.1 5-formyltetrahydrofolate cyclo-ligase [Leptospira selangorensis]
MVSKSEARKKIKSLLLEVPSRKEKEESIRASLLEFLRHFSSSTQLKIISYVADDFEISPFLPLGPSLQIGSLDLDIFFPKVTNSGLEFKLGSGFNSGAFGILEPMGEGLLKPEDADWIIVPALGWNGEGARLGRGKGFYDRSLKDILSEKMIGLSFEDLYPCDFSAEPHDLKAGTVITEKKNHCFPGKMGEKSVG